MGQTLGRAPLPQGCKRFLNLPRSCIYDLWEAFNDIAEGFGLTIEEFQEIIKCALLEYLGVTERVLNNDTEKIFRIFDDDENNLVDSLEFLSAFAMLSGMTPEEKIGFVFAMYDFDESSMLTLDEMILAFRSTLSGLSKLSQVDPPTEAEVEAIVVQGYEMAKKLETQKKATVHDENNVAFIGIEKEIFVKFCLDTPEIVSWIEYFDDIEEYENDLNGEQINVSAIGDEYQRTVEQFAYMNPTAGAPHRMEWERKGLAKDFLPKKNWENTLPFLVNNRLVETSRELPNQILALDWIYGFNSHSSRQSLFYTSKGALVYPAAAVVVVFDISQNQQTHYVEHNDLVTCLKLVTSDTGQSIVASGEVGTKPAVFVWDAETKQTLAVLRGFHRTAIIQVDFSPDQLKLVTVGLDPYHSVAVYLWRTGIRLWAARSAVAKVCDVRFVKDTLFATCGENHILFWSENATRGYSRFRGHFGSAYKAETLWCVAKVGNQVVTGSDSGMLYIWEGRNLIKGLKAHTGAIQAMHMLQTGQEPGLLTACTTGKIQIWNAKLEVCATFNGNTLGPIEPAINSICWETVTGKILIGFRTCEIFEMDSTDGRNSHNSSIVSGHYSKRVGSICPHPTKSNIFCTVGYDKTVRIFDILKKTQIKASMLDTIAKSCAFSPDGQLIFIGLGSGEVGKEERKEGGHVILKEDDLTVIHEARDSKGQITDIKISPNGDYYALASLDGAIYVYNTGDFAAKAKCRGHSGQVRHLDFSTDSQYLRSNCSGGDLLFWDSEKGDQQAPKLMREVDWETENCVFSYSSQGIWGPYADNVEILSVCRSNSNDMLCTVDTCGRLRVYNYPCITDNPNFICLRAHSSKPECVRFTVDDNYVLSCGGNDGCVIQWRVSVPETQNKDELKRDETVDKDQLIVEMRFEGKILDRNPNAENVLNDRPIAQCLLEEGAEANDMLPWQRTIVAPSMIPLENNSEPPDSLELDFIAGFAAERCRESLKYSCTKEILFFSSAIAVVMNQNTHAQRFYNEHTSNITSMAVHPLENIVATGQLGEIPTIKVWNSTSMKTIATLEGFHRRSIVHLAFSPNGELLATVGADKFHTIAVYNWKFTQIIAYSTSFSTKSFYLSFNPSGNGLVQCGKETILFWDINGLNMRSQEALFTSRSRLQEFLCVCWIGSNAVVGTANGNMYRFVGRALDGMIQAHAGCVNSLAGSNDGVCSGGADGFVKIWSRTLECNIVIDTKSLGAVQPNVRCVDWDESHGIILIGTISSEIYEISAFDGEGIHKVPLLQGHSGPELWGLSVHPLKNYYCTVGDDSILRVWNTSQHNAMASVQLEMGARCCAYSPDGRKIAVGFGCPVRLSNKQYDGKWIILDSDDLQVTHEARDSNKWITDMKFSPNGEMLAIGCYDNKIYVYSVSDGYSLSCVIGQHSSFIAHIDFSEDGSWLQSNCGAFELCFFEADTGMYIPAASRLRDVRWATQTCTLGWSVQGIWPPQRDGTEITTCDCNLFRGEDGTVIATGDNYGRVQLFRYPSTSSFSLSKKYKVGSSPLTRVKFVSGDAYLLALCGTDKSIIRWKHVRDRGENVAHDIIGRAGKIIEDDDDVIHYFGLEKKIEIAIDVNDIKKNITSRPWIASIVAPSDISFLENISECIPPEVNFSIHHIFGVQNESTRNSVKYSSQGDIIYPSTKYVSVFNKKSNSQIYFKDHDNLISCIALSHDGIIVASADKSKRPNIMIWDSATCSLVKKLPVLHRRGVTSLQFSNDRSVLLSLGQDRDHSVAIWTSQQGDWFDARLLGWNKGDVNPVLFASFYSFNSFSFVTGGRFHIKFWEINGNSLNPTFAEYENSIKLGTQLCGISMGREFLSGATNGYLFVWQGRRLERTVRAHERGVTCLWSNGQFLVSSSKDGCIKLWTVKLEFVKSFLLTDADIPPLNACVRSIDVSLSNQQKDISVTKILVSTAGSEIFEIAAQSGSICLVQEAHYTGEVWGLATHPFDPDLIATAGDDMTIRVWSLSHKRILRKAVLDCTARCINWSPDGKLFVVGLGGSSDGVRQRKDGAFLILDSLSLKPLFEGRDSRHWIQEAKFNPDGSAFAVASMDHKIYIYNLQSYRLKGTCDRHNSFIKFFDFSEDGIYIQSDSGDFEHLYFEAEDGQYFSSGTHLKDIRWSSWTCIFGWPVQGAWPYVDSVVKGDAVEPCCMHRSPKQDLLGSGNENGVLSIYKYPCVSKKAVSASTNAHVGEIGKVRFTCDNKRIVSIGKYDRAIIVWNLVK